MSEEITASNIKCCTTHSHLFKRHNVHLLCKSQFFIFSVFVVFVKYFNLIIIFSAAHISVRLKFRCFNGFWIHIILEVLYYAFFYRWWMQNTKGEESKIMAIVRLSEIAIIIEDMNWMDLYVILLQFITFFSPWVFILVLFRFNS